MLKPEDTLFLSKENTERLDKEDSLQNALYVSLTSSSNTEIVDSLLQFELLKDLAN